MFGFTKTLALSCLALAQVSLAAPAAASLLAVPSQGSVNVTSFGVVTSGSGCKAGQVGVAIASDYSALTIIFDKFTATDGPGNTLNLFSKTTTCRVKIQVNSPGWAFDVSSSDWRGYVNLDAGVVATITTKWLWDLSGRGTATKIINGPFSDDVLVHKSGENSNVITSKCNILNGIGNNAALTIETTATVNSLLLTGTGLVTGDSLDGAFKQNLNIVWKKC